MKRKQWLESIRWIAVLAMFIATAMLSGCDKGPANAPGSAPGSNPANNPASNPGSGHAGGGAVAGKHAAPHGGTLVPLGDHKYHLEFTIDRDAGRLTAYVLDGEAKQPVMLAQPRITLAITWEGDAPAAGSGFALAAAPEANATEASKFTVVDRDIARRPGKFKVIVQSVTIAGQEFKDVSFDFPQGSEAASP